MNIISTITPLDSEIEASARSLLHDLLDEFGLDRIEIKPGEDYEGDPLIHIDAYFRLSKKPIDSKITTKALLDVFRKFRELGEDRFPFVRFHFHEKQRVVGDKR